MSDRLMEIFPSLATQKYTKRNCRFLQNRHSCIHFRLTTDEQNEIHCHKSLEVGGEGTRDVCKILMEKFICLSKAYMKHIQHAGNFLAVILKMSVLTVNIFKTFSSSTRRSKSKISFSLIFFAMKRGLLAMLQSGDDQIILNGEHVDVKTEIDRIKYFKEWK